MNTIKIIFSIFIILTLISCSLKSKQISLDFKEIEMLEMSKNDTLSFSALNTSDEKKYYKYKVRIPKLISDKPESNLEELQLEIESYTNGFINRLATVAKDLKPREKFEGEIDFEIFYGHKVFTILLKIYQNINKSPIINYKTYYISQDSKYIVNLDEILDSTPFFEYLEKSIKNRLDNMPKLKKSPRFVINMQPALIYFDSNDLFVKFPPYSLSSYSESEIELFKFKESEILEFIREEFK